MDSREVMDDIAELKRVWSRRNTKFQEWYDSLCLVDKLKTENMETFVTNDPRTFFNMAHYLLTTGDIRHNIPVTKESPNELDRRAKTERACRFMWETVDERRQAGGSPSFISELGFFLLLLGWYSVIMTVDEQNQLIPHLWSPANVYPRFEDNKLTACVHEYQLSKAAARRKAKAKGWDYEPRERTGNVTLCDYFIADEDDVLQNMVLIDNKDVTGLVSREDMRILISPIGGFPDKGSINARSDWQGFIGQGVLETDRTTIDAFNRWMSFQQQILRDTAQSKHQEFSANPQATPEQIRERGALFHYSPGEAGLQPVQNQPVPLELRTNLMDIERKRQKGAFSDAVYGMIEGGTSGYALSQLASSSANQILYSFMNAKHFVISECDKFWLKQLKSSKKVFGIKGEIEEQLRPTDISESVNVKVSSEMATQKDWMERSTVANMMKEHVDSETILTDVLKLPDTQSIKKGKNLDDFNSHPLTKQLKLVTAFLTHADFLEARGDARQASLFRKAAQTLEATMGAPEPGAAKPAEATEAEAARQEAAPKERPEVSPEVAPPETRGFTPQQLRSIVGEGKV